MNGGVAVAGDRHASRSGNFSVRQTENLSTERIQRALMLNAGMRSPLKCGAFSFSSRRLSEKTRTYPWLRSASPSSPPKIVIAASSSSVASTSCRTKGPGEH